MNILVTIGARGGSKGVINKNIRDLIGKPLIAHTIGQALKWGKANDVVVTTDSVEIAETAKKYGAKVPFMRPAEMATDSAAKLPVIRHAWKMSENIFATKFDYVIDLDATAPLRKVLDIENCLQESIKGSFLTCFSVVTAHKNPYFNMVELDTSGKVILSKKLEKPVVRRQDAPKVFNMNASIYVYKRDFLEDESKNTIFTERTGIYVMDEISGFDVDREVDFKMIEFFIKEKMWSFDY
jgi:CMP-N,N'-diacetyllegionaminic acid synthase